jgi:hypothetical protein
MLLDEAPVVAHDIAVAHQRRRRDHHFHPRGQRRQRAGQHARDVEQRIAVDDHVGLVDAV